MQADAVPRHGKKPLVIGFERFAAAPWPSVVWLSLPRNLAVWFVTRLQYLRSRDHKRYPDREVIGAGDAQHLTGDDGHGSSDAIPHEDMVALHKWPRPPCRPRPTAYRTRPTGEQQRE